LGKIQIILNPYVFYKVSQIKEQDRDLEGAIEEMELAMGLLNMWSKDEILIRSCFITSRESNRRAKRFGAA